MKQLDKTIVDLNNMSLYRLKLHLKNLMEKFSEKNAMNTHKRFTT